MEYYIIKSLELHLFFGRIMKEHAFFLEVGYTQANCDFINEARYYKEEFEQLLHEVIQCSCGIVPITVFESGEVVTEYTLPSERKTSQLTGAELDETITQLEKSLWNDCRRRVRKMDTGIVNSIRKINQRCLELLEGLIHLKEVTLSNILCCRMFTINYPLLIDHILREAKLYQKYVMNLETEGCCAEEDNLRDTELFWNQIMMEHALFIRGLLDPTENDLIMTADEFAGQYQELLNDARTMTDKTIDSVTNETIEKTEKYRDFKLAGTKGVNECNIQGLILPLLADHVLREANHYLRLLEQCE